MTTDAPIRSLPPQLTSFVGRNAELNDIVDLLTDPDCRLLTLVGPGGIGKSRLAVESALRAAGAFRDGVCFVALQAVHTPEQMVDAVADAMGASLAGVNPPDAQLAAILRDQEILLLLDSAEQLLPDVTLLSRLLHECPRLELLVTSQEVLNLQEEWLYPLHGLAVPDTDSPEDPERFDAVKLFVDRARRVRARFSPADECAEVVRICRLVEGMPLAIELAASWMRDMNCRAIADEIEQNAGFLSTRLRNVPERHRSLHAVFEQTWILLTPAEQQTFRALSVFESGFQREAAQRVGDASLAILTGLVDKSLLRVDTQGRYQLHTLLRQFAREHLENEPGGAHDTCKRHAHYYLGFLADRSLTLTGLDQAQAVREIAAELDNVRAAWRWAVTHDLLADLRQAGGALQTFFDFQSRFREQLETFDHTIQILENRSPEPERMLTLATLLPLRGWSALRMGRLETARESFSRSLDLYRDLDAEPPSDWGLDPLPGLCLVISTTGDYARAIEMAREAEARCLRRGDNANLQVLYYAWQDAAQAQGDYVTARHYAEKAYALTEAAGNRWMTAYVLSQLGAIAQAQGDVEQARRYYTAGYELKQALDDPEGMAAALLQLARLAQMEGALAEAARLYAESEAVYRRIHDQGGLANALQGLGETALARGEIEQAAESLNRALHIAIAMAWTPQLLALLTPIADLLRRRDDPTRALALLGLVLHHPAGEHRTRHRATALLDQVRASLPDETVQEALERGRHLVLDETVRALHLPLATVSAETSDVARTAGADQPLIEPLTPRELEVLAHMADGLTNQEIADALIVAVGTVKSYTSQIYGKLGVRNRTEAVTRAREIDLI